MIKIYNHGHILVPILLGVVAVGLTSAIVYDRMSGGALSNGIRNYFTDDSDGISPNSSQSGSDTLMSDTPSSLPQREDIHNNDDDCMYRGTAEECADYQAQIQQNNNQDNFCNNPENISSPDWSSLCDFGG
jgi:hypothetical protein